MTTCSLELLSAPFQLVMAYERSHTRDFFMMSAGHTVEQRMARLEAALAIAISDVTARE
jgi:hypothetical protein